MLNIKRRVNNFADFLFKQSSFNLRVYSGICLSINKFLIFLGYKWLTKFSKK